MKKKKFGYKLGRSQRARKALFRFLVRALAEHGGIETTYSKAVAVRPEIEKLVKLSKRDDLAAKRGVYAMLGNDRGTAEKLIKDVSPLFKDKNSGYTKIKDLGTRKGDGARLVRYSWSVEAKVKNSKTEKKSTKEPKKRKKGGLRARLTRKEK